MPDRAQQEHTPILRMHTFGTFSLSWDGRRIDVFSRTGSGQDVMLLQLLLHHRREGIPREEMIEALFANRELQDVSHSLQVRLYNLKTKLRAAGLPQIPYVINRGGVFFWTELIQVEEDAEEFETLCRQAMEEADGEKKLPLVLAACQLYTGEFLYLQSDQLWASQEARRYEALFDRCVTDGARLLRERRDWQGLLLLGSQAAAAQPYFGWEALSMEALIALGRQGDAIRLYQKAERQYGAEMRLAPDEKMTLLLEQAQARNALPLWELDRIGRSLIGAELREPGGFLCPYTTFERICRMAQESGGNRVLLGCGFIEERRPRGKEAMEQLMEALCEALRRALPDTAPLTPYGARQFLALLPQMDREERARITEQVDKALASIDSKARLDWSFSQMDG